MRNVEKDKIEMAAKREAMLENGFRLFSEKGIEAVAMQEIANACSIGIATLYRYYNNKLDLVIDIGTRQWEEYGKFASRLREKKKIDASSAVEELEFYLDFYIDLYKNHKDLLRFNQDFNIFVQHEGATPEQLGPYIEAISEIGRYVHRIYEKGKKDGTVRTDIPEMKMFAVTSHLMLAVIVRYSQGLIYTKHSSPDQTEEIELLKRMIIRELTP